ncbi:hypothetical protein FB45DRAFT_1006919 [Roridomyces roridus]|uniref:Uncharacterized protein n=1 Tax=Roridomyces roridus TaxID=1738132 RepID=A0AAD7FF51_9AGAR|nr:hypothetical protein FB45DRAFT_1006919 [Roridomyces roridus]
MYIRPSSRPVYGSSKQEKGRHVSLSGSFYTAGGGRSRVALRLSSGLDRMRVESSGGREEWRADGTGGVVVNDSACLSEQGFKVFAPLWILAPVLSTSESVTLQTQIRFSWWFDSTQGQIVAPVSTIFFFFTFHLIAYGEPALDKDGNVIEPPTGHFRLFKASITLSDIAQGITCEPLPFKCRITPRTAEKAEIIRREFFDAANTFKNFEFGLSEDTEFVLRSRDRLQSKGPLHRERSLSCGKEVLCK